MSSDQNESFRYTSRCCSTNAFVEITISVLCQDWLLYTPSVRNPSEVNLLTFVFRPKTGRDQTNERLCVYTTDLHVFGKVFTLLFVVFIHFYYIRVRLSVIGPRNYCKTSTVGSEKYVLDKMWKDIICLFGNYSMR